MKISIQNYNETYTVEMPDDETVNMVLKKIQYLLACVWHPQTVKEAFVAYAKDLEQIEEEK